MLLILSYLTFGNKRRFLLMQFNIEIMRIKLMYGIKSIPIEALAYLLSVCFVWQTSQTARRPLNMLF